MTFYQQIGEQFPWSDRIFIQTAPALRPKFCPETTDPVISAFPTSALLLSWPWWQRPIVIFPIVILNGDAILICLDLLRWSVHKNLTEALRCIALVKLDEDLEQLNH